MLKVSIIKKKWVRHHKIPYIKNTENSAIGLVTPEK